MSYRDICFCRFYEDCKKGETCHRALTKDVLNLAELYGLRIWQFEDKPDCFEQVNGFLDDDEDSHRNIQ